MDYRYLYRLSTLIVVMFALSALHVLSQEPHDVYNEGISFYSDGDFESAITTWEKLVSSGYSSYELYYNLGNANFKAGSIPGSVLYYEKALLLKPFNEDIRYNLGIATTYVTDHFESIPELFFIKWYRMVSLIFSSNIWLLLSVTLFVLCLSGLLVYLFSTIVNVKKVSFIGSFLLLFLSCITLSLSYQNNIIRNKRQSAVVFAPVVTGKSSPDQSGKDLFVIHEGTKVRVEEELGGWYEIRLSDGNIGWIPSESVKKV